MVCVAAESPLAAYSFRELVELYSAAPEERRRRGREWYPFANRLMRRAARRHGSKLANAVGVMCVLSANCQLSTNVEWTLIALETAGEGEYGAFPNKQGPIVRALLGAPSSAVRALVRGPKIAAFYRAIMGDVDALVVDRWAYLAAAGRAWRFNAKGEELKTDPFGNRERAGAIERAYREAAAAVGEMVRDFQAIVWLQVRETTPNDRGQVRRLADITEG